MDSQYMTTKEVLKYLRIGATFLNRLRKRGEIPKPIGVGTIGKNGRYKRVLYIRAEIEAYAEKLNKECRVRRATELLEEELAARRAERGAY